MAGERSEPAGHSGSIPRGPVHPPTHSASAPRPAPPAQTSPPVPKPEMVRTGPSALKPEAFRTGEIKNASVDGVLKRNPSKTPSERFQRPAIDTDALRRAITASLSGTRNGQKKEEPPATAPKEAAPVVPENKPPRIHPARIAESMEEAKLDDVLKRAIETANEKSKFPSPPIHTEGNSETKIDESQGETKGGKIQPSR